MKLILHLFAIQRPPISVKLFGQHFKHHHFVAVNIAGALFPETNCGRPDEGSDAAKTISQISANLYKVAY